MRVGMMVRYNLSGWCGAVMHPQILSQRYAQGEKNFSRLDMPGADLSGIILAGADLRGSNLQGANLQGANLSRCRLHGANLRGASLHMANLRRANLHQSNLSLCSLVWCDLTGATLREADLRHAILDQPRPHPPRWTMMLLSLAFLGTMVGLWVQGRWGAGWGCLGLALLVNGAAMAWRSPTAAKLRGADLRGADLTGAQLQGMYLLHTRCQGATLPNGWRYQFWLNWFPWD